MTAKMAVKGSGTVATVKVDVKMSVVETVVPLIWMSSPIWVADAGTQRKFALSVVSTKLRLSPKPMSDIELSVVAIVELDVTFESDGFSSSAGIPF
jgi:hypothetical protein